jgi:hypothetical protein
MPFTIRLGEPEILKLFEDLQNKAREASLTKEEGNLLKLWIKSIERLREDPRHPALETHEIDILSKKFGERIWQSYLNNHSKNITYRLFWAYGPNQNEITLLALEAHPNNKKDSYKKIVLSSFPKNAN